MYDRGIILYTAAIILLLIWSDTGVRKKVLCEHFTRIMEYNKIISHFSNLTLLQ